MENRIYCQSRLLIISVYRYSDDIAYYRLSDQLVKGNDKIRLNIFTGIVKLFSSVCLEQELFPFINIFDAKTRFVYGLKINYMLNFIIILKSSWAY